MANYRRMTKILLVAAAGNYRKFFILPETSSTTE